MEMEKLVMEEDVDWGRQLVLRTSTLNSFTNHKQQKLAVINYLNH